MFQLFIPLIFHIFVSSKKGSYNFLCGCQETFFVKIPIKKHKKWNDGLFYFIFFFLVECGVVVDLGGPSLEISVIDKPYL